MQEHSRDGSVDNPSYLEDAVLAMSLQDIPNEDEEAGFARMAGLVKASSYYKS